MVSGRRRFVSLAVTIAALLSAALYGVPAAAEDPNPPVGTFTWTPNMEPLGWEPRPNPSSGIYNSDLAFWGNRAYQGTYDGFQIIDITNPDDPQQVLDYNQCGGDQGDLVVWGNILVRSWNSGASPSATCDGQQIVPPLPDTSWEGLHVFDISNELNPALVASVNLTCGSHTQTGVPDLANNRLLIYNSGSSGTCPSIEIVEIPLGNPAGAAFLRTEPNGRGSNSCHDTTVILGDVLRAACAGGTGFTVWSLDPADGGSLTDPMLMYTKTVAGVSIGHSHAFSWDGSVLIFGHEPGGGSQARCESSDAQVDKTLFFYDTETGNQIGTWVLPRPQTSTENCTVHNFNVIPSNKHRILVLGNYQSGIAVVNFTDPTAPVEIAYADPAPLSPTTLQLGGDWSSYWYNGTIYESDITRGMLTWRLNDPVTSGAQNLGHLNPQTQEFSIPFVGAQADMSIGKTGPSGRQPTGRNMTYTLSVANNGPDPATGVVVSDALPPSVTFVSATPSQGTCVQDAGVVTCELGTMASGAGATITIVVKPTQAGVITNTATVSSATGDSVAANNTASVDTSICRITSRRSSIPCG
jgi:uncharacterized repeat protein (TIGR01451 family)